MRYLFIMLLFVTHQQCCAQFDNIPVKFDNKTAYAFTCKGSSGEVFTISDKMNKDLATITAYSSKAVLLMVGKKGSITWMDISKGATLKLLIDRDAAGKRTFKTESSHHFTAVVAVARVVTSSLDIIQVELTGSYEVKPPPGIRLPNSGTARTMCFWEINTAIEGSPADTTMKHAFDVLITVPDLFYPTANGKETYKGQKGFYTGEKTVPATLKWAQGSRIEGGDSVVLMQVIAEGLPEELPVWVTVIPTNSSKWTPGSKLPRPSGANRYYKIFVSEREPGSPHYNINSAGILFFDCIGRWWQNKLLPADIITQKNFKEKINKRPGVYELKDNEQVKTAIRPEQIKTKKTAVQKAAIKQ